jgi:hypothetical protein
MSTFDSSHSQLNDLSIRISQLREKIDVTEKPEIKVILQLMELMDERQELQLEQFNQLLRTGNSIFKIIGWLVTVIAGIAAIYAGFHAKIQIR